MTDYRCPSCRKVIFRAVGLRYEALEVICPRCGALGTPKVSGPLQGQYGCPGCGVHSYREKPIMDVDYCVRCGMTMPPVLPATTGAPSERASVTDPNRETLCPIPSRSSTI